MCGFLYNHLEFVYFFNFGSLSRVSRELCEFQVDLQLCFFLVASRVATIFFLVVKGSQSNFSQLQVELQLSFFPLQVG